MLFVEISQYLSNLIPFLLGISSIVGVFLYKKIADLHKKILVYLIMMFCFEVTIRVLKTFNGTNHLILPLFSLTELSFFLLFYKKHLLKKKNLALTTLGIFGITYIIGEIVYYFIINNVSATDFQPYSKVVDNAVIVLMALTFLQEKMSDFSVSKWENFRLNLVILVFFTLNTLIFLPFNFLVNESSGVKFYFWTGNVIMLLAFYSFLISEIWRNAKTRRVNA